MKTAKRRPGPRKEKTFQQARADGDLVMVRAHLAVLAKLLGRTLASVETLLGIANASDQGAYIAATGAEFFRGLTERGSELYTLSRLSWKFRKTAEEARRKEYDA